jgi:hypothetical protein
VDQQQLQGLLVVSLVAPNVENVQILIVLVGVPISLPVSIFSLPLPHGKLSHIYFLVTRWFMAVHQTDMKELVRYSRVISRQANILVGTARALLQALLSQAMQ